MDSGSQSETYISTQSTDGGLKLSLNMGTQLLKNIHKCFKCWWLALPEIKTITKPLINSVFKHDLSEGPSYPVLTIIKEMLRHFES